MGTMLARNKSRIRRGRAPSDVGRVTSYVLRNLKVTVSSRRIRSAQCVSDPAARRISGAATWDSSLRYTR